MIDFNDYTKHTTPILTLSPISTTILTEPHIFTTNNNNDNNNTETTTKIQTPTTTTLPILHSPITSPLKQQHNVNNKRDYDSMSEESYNHLHTPCSTSTESPNDLMSGWEMTDTVAQLIIEVLGAMLKKVKKDIWNALLQQQHKYVDDIPDIPLMAIKTFLYQVQEDDNNINNTKPFNQQSAAEMYCLMTGFMSVYLGLIEILFNDLVQQDNNNVHLNGIKPFDQFIGFFACKDDVISSSDDYFTWYHWQHRNELVNDLQYRFYTKGIQPFRSLTLIDTVITQFYTTHLLQPVAQQHRKDHGQFYTPQSVVQFMWNRCLNNNNSHEQQQQSSSFLINNNEIRLPRVFDPCMGIGSFLCEYLTRLIDQIKKNHQEEIWNNGHVLKNILSQLSETIWGVEIDPFAFKLGKLNIMIHMFPFYQRCLFLLLSPSSSPSSSLNDQHHHHQQPDSFFQDFKIGRLSLFRNDTLRLDINYHHDSSSSLYSISLWERQQLEKLRDPSQLSFDYIVTNPPYMIRKTGFINDPDTTLYDDTYLGGKGTQAYMYFMWFCLQRCHPISGQLCFITPSQWTVLQFAESLRSWIWKNCQLLEFFQFEPYKVWPKVQTDSLIFRIRKRPNNNIIENNNDDNNDHYHQYQQVLFLRYLSRKSSLTEILNAYERFDPTSIHSLTSSCQEEDPFIKYKLTPTNNLQLFDTTMHKSFGYLSPTSIVSDQLMEITRHHPRLCDGERGKKGSISPLIWHRGPNTNPVYGLVVRTQWAMDQFGKDYCDRWLRPVFYWNGKSSMSRSSSSLYISPSSSSSTSSSSSSSVLTSTLLPINASSTITNTINTNSTSDNNYNINNNNDNINNTNNNNNNNINNTNNNNNCITSADLIQQINKNINNNNNCNNNNNNNNDSNNNLNIDNININNNNNNNNNNSNNNNENNSNLNINNININNNNLINTYNNYKNNMTNFDLPPPPPPPSHHQQQQQQQNHSNELINDKRCKEIKFWYHRDPQRLNKKETSPAEAYVPFDRLDENNQPFYSIILINKDDSEKLDPTSPLYQHLKEARQELQPGQIDKKIAWCHYNKCGMDQPVKFVHPINFGYFSRTQPRQRFFMDRSYRCVTNQCMYFTIKANQPIIQSSSSLEEIKKKENDEIVIKKENDHHHQQQQQEQEMKMISLSNTHIEYYFLGILNSSTVQFFIRAYCYYDQQGRTRFFGKHMASIPYAIPTTNQIIKMDDYVQQLVIVRHLIYFIIRYVDNYYYQQQQQFQQNDHHHHQQQQQQCKSFSSIKTIMDKVRNCTWDLSFIDYNLLRPISPQFLSTIPLPISLENSNNKDKWLKIKIALENGGGDLANQMIRLLIAQSLLQYGVDHLTFDIYHIPHDLQIGLEQELGLSLTLQWQMYQDHFQKYTGISGMITSILNGTLLID